MALRRDDRCSVCDAALPAGTRAQWDSAAKSVTCVECVDGGDPTTTGVTDSASISGALSAEPTSGADIAEPQVAAVAPIESGRAGVSARQEFERRHAKHERQIEQKWGTGRIGKVAKFLSDDPQTTKAWASGAKGEERVAKILHDRLDASAVLLHDRKVPGTRGNIDHLAVARTGVWIIDAKRYTGKVERRDVGGFFKSDWRLYVGGRDRTKAVIGLEWQLEAVRSALGEEDVPVHCALSFVDAEWPLLFRKPFQLQDVWISWPSKLAELIAGEGDVSQDMVERLATALSHKLPAHTS